MAAPSPNLTGRTRARRGGGAVTAAHAERRRSGLVGVEGERRRGPYAGAVGGGHGRAGLRWGEGKTHAPKPVANGARSVGDASGAAENIRAIVDTEECGGQAKQLREHCEQQKRHEKRVHLSVCGRNPALTAPVIPASIFERDCCVKKAIRILINITRRAPVDLSSHNSTHHLSLFPPPSATSLRMAFSLTAAARAARSPLQQHSRTYKVAVLGAAGGIGQPLSLLLKLNPRVTVST